MGFEKRPPRSVGFGSGGGSADSRRFVVPKLQYKSAKMGVDKRATWPFGFGSDSESANSRLGSVVAKDVFTTLYFMAPGIFF